MRKERRKQIAFTPVEGEKNIGIINPSQFKFTKKWFRRRNQKTWSTFLLPKFNQSVIVNMLQIGVFEGMDLVWSLQHILTNRQSTAVGIDPWLPTRKLDEHRMKEVEENARFNLADPKITLIKGKSQEVLKSFADNSFNLIVVDGDHDYRAVYKDAMLSYPLLRVGGWMVFDDVRNRVEKRDHVQRGLNDFKRDFGEQMKEVWFHRYCDCLEKVE